MMQLAFGRDNSGNRLNRAGAVISLRILFTVHHGRNEDAGAWGSTYRLGEALRRLGHEYEIFDYGEAFGSSSECVKNQVRFPASVLVHLRRCAKTFDVIDGSSGDLWQWLLLGRPGGKPVAVTRCHGIEHEHHRARVEASRHGGVQLRRRYWVYHGGWRLREVATTLRRSDGVVVFNESDVAEAVRLGVDRGRLRLISHGIDDRFLAVPPPREASVPTIAIIGTWLERKGVELAAASLRECLRRNGATFNVLVAGCGDEAGVRRDLAFLPDGHLQIVPTYLNGELPAVLESADVILWASRAEGFGLALLEAMACGLAAVATPVGVAPLVVKPGSTGYVIERRDPAHVADLIDRCLAERPELLEMRAQAQARARGFTWEAAARSTVAFYEELQAMQGASALRGDSCV